MELVKPNYEIWEQSPGIEGVYKQIERAGRTCYKSENKIEENSAKSFVDRMIKKGHYAMLEHGTVYLRVNYHDKYDFLGRNWVADAYSNNPYSIISFERAEPDIFITTNYRVLIENDWLDHLKYCCEPTESHEKRITVKFICDRGVSHEFVRHRVFSFAQESTRYCNYSKDKFGNEITFIIPSWLNLSENNYGTIDNPFDIQFKEYDNPYEAEFINGLLGAEFRYMNLLSNWENKVSDKRFGTGFKGNPWTPQQARQILPNALKTELIMTGFVSDWKHFFDLRALGTTGKPHPDAYNLAYPLYKEFINRGYIDE